MVRRRLAERWAKSILDKQGIRAPKVDPFAIARALGAEIVESPSGDGKSGMVAREQGRVVIGINSSESPVRRRFTCAHEIGHVLLHANEPLIIDDFGYALLGERKGDISPREVEANAFAAALLMPGEWLAREMKNADGIDVAGSGSEDLAALAARFGVSQQAMMFRLINLGYIKNL